MWIYQECKPNAVIHAGAMSGGGRRRDVYIGYTNDHRYTGEIPYQLVNGEAGLVFVTDTCELSKHMFVNC